jgi:methyl-accepting chemotaxis protein
MADMKFRTKILMMPASAALLFTAGVAVTVALGSQLSNSIRLLRQVDEPYLAQVMRIDRASDLVQATVQSATTEGDADKLAEVAPSVKEAHDAFASIEGLEGKAGVAQDLADAFAGYETSAVSAARTLLSKDASDKSAKVSAMQAALARLTASLKTHKSAARAEIDRRYDAATAGAANGILVVVGTGLIVLAGLVAASWIVIKSLWRELGEEPERLRDAVGRIASGEIDVDAGAETAHRHSIRGALGGMCGGLRAMITDIRQVADSIHTASAEIAAGNQDLSQRTEQTASNLQQAASAMEQLTVTVRQTAASAGAATGLASAAVQAAERGGSVVSQVVTNMQEINSSSKRISEIIGVIDGIAFQTNILALNAAVEAARAGEQGRGFAVVASEVRNLAMRSATAAQEIKALIVASSQTIEGGTRLVLGAGATMKEIVDSVQRVNDIIAEIAAASGEQSSGIGAMTGTVADLDRMTQQNAALVEQSAAAAMSLSQQTERLNDSVSRFRIADAEVA